MKGTGIGDQAATMTDAQFASTISSFTQFTDDQVTALFPKQADREELARLIDIVRDAADENDRRARLIQNITKVAGAVSKILTKTAIPV